MARNGNGNGIPTTIRKRDGTLAEFRRGKIVEAVFAAAESVGGSDRDIAEQVTNEIVSRLKERRIPTVDEINAQCVNVLNEQGYDGTASAFSHYAKRRQQVREKLNVLGGSQGTNPTDKILLVSSFGDETTSLWDRNRIVESLIAEAGLDLNVARRVAKGVENTVVLSNFKSVTTGLVRTLAHAEMVGRGFVEKSRNYLDISLPRSTLRELFESKHEENSNIQGNNPCAVEFAAWEHISKQFALTEVFSPEVAMAHTTGAIHLHDLGLINRVYCSGHSLAFIAKYGLDLDGLQTTSKPANHALVLTAHLNTFLASMQAYYAGALGIGAVNIFYAPLIENDLREMGLKKIDAQIESLNKIKERATNGLEGILEQEITQLEAKKQKPIEALSEKERDEFVEQVAQNLIYSLSQNAFSRGGQTLFLDTNVHTGVPEYLRDALAIGPSGDYILQKSGERIRIEERKIDVSTSSGFKLSEYYEPETGRVVAREELEEVKKRTRIKRREFLEAGEKLVTYGDYESGVNVVKRFAMALLKTWEKGDADGGVFAFPKCDLHIDKDTFESEDKREVFERACEVASKNGSPYFIFDRDAVTMAACCRLRTTLDDPYVFKHPESLRFCGFQNVTINLPQAALRAKRNNKNTLEGFFEEVDGTMDIAMQAHLEKKEFVQGMQVPGAPHWQVGKESPDGRPYIDLDKATYIMGILGLNEALQSITGKQLHEMSKEEYRDYALRTIAHMHQRAKGYTDGTGLKVSLEETPAESTAGRFAKIDYRLFPESKEFLKGDQEKGDIFYTNSVHFAAEAPLGLQARIEAQSMMHPLITSGAIIHAFVGEERPEAGAIGALVKNTYDKTQCAQLTISPEMTVCRKCHQVHRGLLDSCPECGEQDDVQQITRIVGYFSAVRNWNTPKRRELVDRHEGNYSLKTREQVFEVPDLERPSEGIVAYEFGKANCGICDVVAGRLEKAIEGNPGLRVERVVADTDEGLTKLMVARINPSELPTVVFVDSQGEIGRITTGYKDGMADPRQSIHTGAINKILENYIAQAK